MFKTLRISEAMKDGASIGKSQASTNLLYRRRNFERPFAAVIYFGFPKILGYFLLHCDNTFLFGTKS